MTTQTCANCYSTTRACSTGCMPRWSSRSTKAVADLVDALNLNHPRLVLHQARQLELNGAGREALTRIDAATSGRATSSDRGWLDLADLRNAIEAREVARARSAAATARPYRPGHSAPDTRPDRRRFTLTAPAAGTPVSKPRTRKSRQRHAGR